MGTEGIAAIAAAGSKQPVEKQQAGGSGQSSQIAELQYLEQTIKKMENDYQSKARTQGVSSVEISSKVRAFDNLIAKVDEQITQLQQSSREGTAPARGEVSTLHYSTAAAMVAMRNSGESIHTVLTQTTQAIQQKSQEAQQEARKAERMAEEEKQAESLKPSGSASLNVLV